MHVRAWMAVLVIECIGACVLTLLCRDLRRWTMAGRLGMSFGLGLAVLTLSMFIVSLAGLRPVWWFGVVELCALAGAAAWVRRRGCSDWWHVAPCETSPRRAGRARLLEGIVNVVAVLFITTTILLASAVALREPAVEWDIVSIWMVKAKVLLHEPVLTSTYFQDVGAAYSHLDYPLLWPAAMAWVWAFTGASDPVTIKVLGPAVLCALGASLYGFLRRCTDVRGSLLFTALLVGVPMVLSHAVRLRPEVILSLYVLGSFACAYLWLRERHGDDLRLAGFFAAGMMFTKNEGAGLFVILIVLVGVAVVVRRRPRERIEALVHGLIVPVALTVAWFAFRASIPKVHENYLERIRLSVLEKNITRVPEVFTASWQFFTDLRSWFIFWPLLAVVTIGTVRWWIRDTAWILVAAIVLALGMYGLTYVVTPWDLGEQMEVSANRLLLQLAPLCALIMAVQVRLGRLDP